MNRLYYPYSEYLLDKYGEKVYKLPINISTTCPNRDGTIGINGCVFCDEKGAGHESLSNKMTVKEQIIKNKSYIGKKYGAKKYIAYFQTFTNTYLYIEDFKRYMYEACEDGVIELCISTRPDCIKKEHLDILNEVKKELKVNIHIELGLQTVNYHTLRKIKRGHTLSEFIKSVLIIKEYSFDISVHLILNLPWDNIIDTIENAKILSAFNINSVKIHSLYIMKDTELADFFKKGKVEIIPLKDYIKLVKTFLEYLSPDIAIQRLVSRAPKENSIFVNWNTSWWRIKDEIINHMEESNTWQGKKFDKGTFY